MRILADASLPCLSLLFTEPFHLTLYHSKDALPELLLTHDILLCRSTLTVNETLLAHTNIKGVATASSGVDHIDSEYLKKRNIALFDAKGCNARAVADYMVATLASLQQQDKIIGSKAGVIGVGEVGKRVVARLQAAGFEVICFDPLSTTTSAAYTYGSFSDLSSCDVLCIHPNLHHNPPYPSANLLSADFLDALKPGTTLINAARGGIVNEEALLKNGGLPLTYCTDVYEHEPSINANIIDFATLCTPHIAGHSIEAKINAVSIVSEKMHAYFGYPQPKVTLPTLQTPPVLLPKETWQDVVLSIYNPLHDTNMLKSASDKTLAFLTQRQAHYYRHDFNVYDSAALDEKTMRLMGL